MLVVDDSETVLARVRGALEPRGYVVVATADWVQANKIVHSVRPSLVVLDHHIGHFKGTFLVRALRTFFGPDLPILLMSSEPVGPEAAAAGATGFVPKEHLGWLPDLIDAVLECPEAARCRRTTTDYGTACDCGRAKTTRRRRREELQ